jgi:S-methylmethionine-dependent homocysteine/selenocysteine methylase
VPWVEIEKAISTVRDGDILPPMIDQPVVVLDGGMGKELHRIGAPFVQPEWSALALMEEPQSVLQAHRNFIEAGADVITVNSYAVVPFHIGDERFADRGAELIDLAGKLARQAADEADRPVRVAASVPPMFGSYEPHRFDAETAPGLLATMVEAQRPWVDLWIGETIGSTIEAEAMLAALSTAGIQQERWLSFSLNEELVDGRPVLWSGESIEDAAKSASVHDVNAVLFNCAPPEIITAALPTLVATLRSVGSSMAVGAYANAFPPKPEGDYAANEVVLGRRDDLTDEAYADAARGWVVDGATIVGGCCGIHPEHIAQLSERFHQV